MHEYGYEAYCVGGAVRDLIMGRLSGDWDVATSAHPHQVQAIFSKTIETGIEHGTVTVCIENDAYEVTTYRVDVGISDGRRPDHVTFSGSLLEDLERRDFTINAMAWNPLDQSFYDPFDGMTKPLKSDMEMYYDTDADLVKIKAQIDYQKTIIETLEEIMGNIRWRHTHVKNILDFKKFTSGM